MFQAYIIYEVHVNTGDVRNASTSANVFIVLHGREDVWREEQRETGTEESKQ